MRIPMPLADCPAGGLTGIGIVACTIGAGLLCLCVAGAIRLGATDVAFRHRAVRGRLIAAGACVGCAVLPVAASFLDMAQVQQSVPLWSLYYLSVLALSRATERVKNNLDIT